jgi:hypothetical protein
MARHAALPLAGSNRQAASAGYTKVDERTHDWADSLPRNPFGHWVPRHARMNGWRVLGSDKGDRNVSSVGGCRDINADGRIGGSRPESVVCKVQR